MGRHLKAIEGETIFQGIAKGQTLKTLSVRWGCHRATIYRRFHKEIVEGRKEAVRLWREEFDRRRLKSI